jgi:DNA-binding LytR/AlgR family response regulator
MNKHILIVEDEVILAEHLSDILRSNGFKEVSMAHDKSSALEALEHHEFGLALLDIQMDKQLVGLEIAQTINDAHFIPFIFITAHSDKKIINQAIEMKPRSYITKPFKSADVVAAAELAFMGLETQRGSLKFKDGWEMCQLEFDDILLARSDGNYIQISTADKRFLVRYTLDWFIKSVPTSQFYRVHRNTVVNLNKIKRLSGSELQIGDESVSVSRSHIRELKDRMGIV